ncbi:hypothetical protein EVAR_98751_1 [Eumeta japonica]|uniref:Uncharacterized protein n=1 Tax=Eumeta variegata TaxID=151549 RepID=A0A4C1YT05_EUMVA|nr:hypothetical protein EVAR_98751_1 [Eumeta japonica]
MGPPDGGSSNPTLKLTDWKRVSTALEKIDTPSLNSMPDDISTTDDASAYPIAECRSRARAIQRRVRARVEEVRNENWSDLMDEITPSHKAFWKVTKALEIKGDDADLAECLADRIPMLLRFPSARHCSYSDMNMSNVQNNVSLESKDDLPPVSLSEVQTLLKSLKTKKAPGLEVHSCPQQILCLVEYISEGFKSKQKTVVFFFDVAKAFDRSGSFDVNDESRPGTPVTDKVDAMLEKVENKKKSHGARSGLYGGASLPPHSWPSETHSSLSEMCGRFVVAKDDFAAKKLFELFQTLAKHVLTYHFAVSVVWFSNDTVV